MTTRVIFVVALFQGVILSTQAANPSQLEDAAIERRKILRAADQIELLTEQVNKLQQDIQSLQRDIEFLKTKNHQLEQQLEISETRRAKERELLLAEVAKSIARVSKRKAEEAAAAAVAKAAPQKSEQGYEHTVEKGETLWAIARAYRDQGVSVTPEDIRLANGMRKDSILRIGQRLFIPRK